MIRWGDITLDDATMTITHGARVKKFQTRKNRSVAYRFWKHLICGGGMSREQLFDALYGHDPNGGPNMGVNQLDVQLCQYTPQIAAIGLKVVREKRAGIKFWRIVPDVV